MLLLLVYYGSRGDKRKVGHKVQDFLSLKVLKSNQDMLVNSYSCSILWIEKCNAFETTTTKV